MNEIKMSDYIKNDYEDYYKDVDSEWRRITAVGKADNIVSLCSSLPRRSILEIGAGEGAILKRLSELNFGEEFYAIEISQSAVEAIKNKKIHRLVECKLFDGYHVPYDNNRFDIAILSHVIEHVEFPRQLLYEAARVAKYVFIEVPMEDTIRRPKDFVFDKFGHINFFSPKTIRWLIQSSNLRVIKQIIVNPRKEFYISKNGRKGLINYYIKQILLDIVPCLATKLFGYFGALVCEKSVHQEPHAKQ
jgi:ubiquinone/menaquinone biosynthesis C-methylase UbiE